MSVFSVGTMCVHTGCPITLALCIPNRGSFVPNSKAQKGWSLIKSHWGQYSQLVQGWCHSITHPTGSSLRYTADWLPQQESCGRQGGVGRGLAKPGGHSLATDSNEFTKILTIQRICLNHSQNQHFFFFFFTKRKPRKFPQAMELFNQLSYLSWNLKRARFQNPLYFEKWAE